VLALAVAACGGSDSSSGTASKSGDSAGGKVAPITVAVPITDSVFAYPYVAEALGYYKKAGVDVKTLDAVTSANGLNMLVSGQADVTMQGTAGAFGPVLRGKETSVIYNFSGGGLGGDLAVASDSANKTIQDLGGKPVGTVGVNGSAYGYTQIYSDAAKKGGAKPFNTVSLADPTTLANALKSGRVAGAVGPAGWFSDGLINKDARLLVDTTDPATVQKLVGGYFAENSFFGIKDNLQKKRESVVRFLKALDMANTWVHNHSADELATLLHDKVDVFKEIPIEKGKQSADFTSHFWTPDRGRISEAMWQKSLPIYKLWNLQGVDVTSPKFAYDQRVDMSYLDQALK
jgi:NitT/TauT family transport system substrate-binding protein